MGLDTSHDCWHGAYSAFTVWRNAVAEAAGYAVWPVQWHDKVCRPTIMIDWGHIASENPGHLLGEWNTSPADPLFVLFAHQDCEGVIHPQHAGPLADRLEEVYPHLEAVEGWQLEHLQNRTRKFIDGLRRAVAANEDVDFH